eukprot:8569980-Lingulodinium_polyedra.AAC.1
MVAAYFWTGLGISHPKNVKVWNAAFDAAVSSGLPFIVGADWNTSPQEVEDMIATTGVGAIVVAPEDELTFVADKGGSRIDFFVISKTLAPLVKSIEVDKDSSIKGHRPVHLRLS